MPLAVSALSAELARLSHDASMLSHEASTRARRRQAARGADRTSDARLLAAAKLLAARVAIPAAQLETQYARMHVLALACKAEAHQVGGDSAGRRRCLWRLRLLSRALTAVGAALQRLRTIISASTAQIERVRPRFARCMRLHTLRAPGVTLGTAAKTVLEPPNPPHPHPPPLAQTAAEPPLRAVHTGTSSVARARHIAHSDGTDSGRARIDDLKRALRPAAELAPKITG